jgi:hypothetical protein
MKEKAKFSQKLVKYSRWFKAVLRTETMEE